MPYIRHESGEAGVLKNQQALGDASPLAFDEDGYAWVEDPEAAELVAALDRHVTVEPAVTRGDREDDFDAEAFVDRTPMEDVIADLESGEYDDHLEAIAEAATRSGVQDAIDARRG